MVVGKTVPGEFLQIEFLSLRLRTQEDLRDLQDFRTQPSRKSCCLLTERLPHDYHVVVGKTLGRGGAIDHVREEELPDDSGCNTMSTPLPFVFESGGHTASFEREAEASQPPPRTEMGSRRERGGGRRLFLGRKLLN